MVRSGSNWRYTDLAPLCEAGLSTHLLLIIKTAAPVRVNETDYHLSPNTLLLMQEDDGVFYFSAEDAFVCDWIFFHAEEIEIAKILTMLSIPLATPARLSDSSTAATIIKLIAAETLFSTPHGAAFASSMIQALFLKLSETILQEEPPQNTAVPSSPYADRLTALRNKIYATPEEHWTVERMCRELNISRTHLHRLYAETFGVTCYNDVLNSKMEHAKQLLAGSSLPIHEVSERCAFDNDVSFMRCFKKVTGLTPTQFRSKSCSKTEHT